MIRGRIVWGKTLKPKGPWDANRPRKEGEKSRYNGLTQLETILRRREGTVYDSAKKIRTCSERARPSEGEGEKATRLAVPKMVEERQPGEGGTLVLGDYLHETVEILKYRDQPREEGAKLKRLEKPCEGRKDYPPAERKVFSSGIPRSLPHVSNRQFRRQLGGSGA